MAGRSVRQKLPTTDPNLQDQVQSLMSENERLRAIITQHGLSEVLSTDRRIPNQTIVQNSKTPSPSQTPSNLEIAASGTPRRKGCSCRGNCSTRICGCVKKQIPCAEFCRCADEQCQNQEPDKENIGDPENQTELSEEGQDNLRKLAKLSIKDTNESKEDKSRRSNKRVENVSKKRGLFSPLSTTTSPDLNIQELVHRPLRFGGNSDSETDKNEDEVFENNAVPENSKSNNATRVPGRSRRQNLAPVKPQAKARVASNKEQEAGPSTQAKKVGNKRSASLGGSGDAKAPNDTHNKTLAGLINGTKPLRRAAAAKLGEASSNNYGNIEDQESNHEKIEEANKKATKTEKGKSKRKGNKNPKPTHDEQAEVNELLEEAANHIQLAAQQKLLVEPQNEERMPDPGENSKAESEKHSDGTIETDHVKTEPQEDFVPPEDIYARYEQSSSNSSPGSDLCDRLQIDDPNFDPMKPRHKLTRSPLGPRVEPRAFLDVSERPLPPPMEEAAEELPPPEELNSIIVDWDKHQQQRVYCSKCHRGFYPYRIKKHEASCKKV